MTRAQLISLFATLLIAGCTTPRTEAVVVISTSGLRIPTDLDAIRLTVIDIGPNGPETKFENSLPLCQPGQPDSPTSHCFELPITVGLIPGPSQANDSVRVQVEALVDRRAVISDSTLFTFVTNERLRFDFVLYANCIGNLDCSTRDQACGPDGQCAAVIGTPFHGPLDLGANALDGSSGDFTTGKAQGAACTSSSECSTAGGCVDGYCCDQACSGACVVCNVQNREGVCSPTPVGVTPAPGHAGCTAQLANTCGTDGTCDGAGSCRNWPLGTVCAASACNSNTNLFVAESTCDGLGTCNTPNPIACDPFLCEGSSCGTTCTLDGQCKSPATCVNNSCGKKTNGSTCSMDIECSNNHCVDGVCCDSACSGTCTVCNLTTARGQCSVVPAGSDPRKVCPAGTGNDAICRPGGCDGTAPACRVAMQGTACGGTCNNKTPVALTCDANGSCSQSTTGVMCTVCKQCVVSNNVAGCSANVTDGTPCAAGFCLGSQAFREVSCLQGVCPPQTAQDCGAYNCYTSGTGAYCYTDCGYCPFTTECMYDTPPVCALPERCAVGYGCWDDCSNRGMICQ